MAKKMEINNCECKGHWKHHRHMGAGYGLGFIGALAYFLPASVGFWGVLLAILKAMVWPAFVVFHLLKFLGA